MTILLLISRSVMGSVEMESWLAQRTVTMEAMKMALVVKMDVKMGLKKAGNVRTLTTLKTMKTILLKSAI